MQLYEEHNRHIFQLTLCPFWTRDSLAVLPVTPFHSYKQSFRCWQKICIKVCHFYETYLNTKQWFLCNIRSCHFAFNNLGTGRATKSDEFSEKFQKGGGWSFSIQKFMLQILGTLNRAFWAWNWYKRIISGLFADVFSTIVFWTIETRYTLQKALLNSPPPLELFRKFIRFGDAPPP